MWRLPWLIFPLWKWRHPNFVTCIKRSTPSQDYIIWYQSFGSWYRFYPILSYFFFFVICLGSFFCSCSVICVLVYILFRFCLRLVFCYLRSCLHLVSFLFLFLVSFTLCVNKKMQKFWKKKCVWSLNTKLRHLEVFFLKENRGTNPLI